MTAVEQHRPGSDDRAARLQAVVDALGTARGEWRLIRVVKVRQRPVRFRLCGAFHHPCDRCGSTHIFGGDTNVDGGDIRNPHRLARLARSLGAPLTATYTAERGRRLIRALYRAAEAEGREW